MTVDDDGAPGPSSSSSPGPSIGTGRTADVFDLGGGLVLRRYRDGLDAEREAAVQRHVVAHGYPAPRVVSASGQDLTMERVDGPTMLAALAGGGLDPGTAARILAGLHDDLHALPTPHATPNGAVPGAVVHLDLHPDNVLLDPVRGPVLIDWSNAGTGPADMDVAMTALILAEAAVAPPGSELARLAGDARALAADLGMAFLAAVTGDALAGLDDALAMRSANATLSDAERARLGAAAAAVRSWAAR